jgi:hypothetical protein
MYLIPFLNTTVFQQRVPGFSVDGYPVKEFLLTKLLLSAENLQVLIGCVNIMHNVFLRRMVEVASIKQIFRFKTNNDNMLLQSSLLLLQKKQAQKVLSEFKL